MNLLRKLWDDEQGVILSMETVLLGTVGVLGLTTGLSFLASAVNAELQDLGSAIRGVDQSYSISGSRNCAGHTANSSYQQLAVQETLLDLRSPNCQPSISGDTATEDSTVEVDRDVSETETFTPDPAADDRKPKQKVKPPHSGVGSGQRRNDPPSRNRRRREMSRRPNEQRRNDHSGRSNHRRPDQELKDL